jgi:hypothetical protein
MCSHPDCKARLVLEATDHDNPVLVGEAAHMVAAAPRGPRGARESEFAVHSYDNLILLCRHHHAVIDRQAGTHSVEMLRTWKAEHESWVTAVTSVAGDLVPWTGIVQEDEPRTDVLEAQAALGPGHRLVRLEALRSSPAQNDWLRAAAVESRRITQLLAGTSAESRRFAVFSMGRIPLAVQLGYLLGDRARVWLFRYDRDAQTWAWPADGKGRPGKPSLLGPRLRQTGKRNGRAVVRISLSASIRPEDVAEVVDAEVDLEIAAPKPSVRWLRSPEQLNELSRAYAEALALLRRQSCRSVHLFYAGPGPGAVCFGRAYNPTMNPPLVLYEYGRSAGRRYRPVLELNGVPLRG